MAVIWLSLHGRRAAMDGGRSILQDRPPLMAAGGIEARPVGGAGRVICNERLEPGTTIATGILVAEDGIRGMGHHQAAITSATVPGADGPCNGLATLQ